MLSDKGQNEQGSPTCPDYCKTISFRDAHGVVKQLIFPKALDLDRPKRARTTFSNDQLDKLEEAFNSSQYLVGKERMALAEQLGLSETQVKVWFQNRRTKRRKDVEKKHQTPDATAETLATKSVLKMLEYKSSVPFSSVAPQIPTICLDLEPPSRHHEDIPSLPKTTSLWNRPPQLPLNSHFQPDQTHPTTDIHHHHHPFTTTTSCSFSPQSILPNQRPDHFPLKYSTPTITSPSMSQIRQSYLSLVPPRHNYNHSTARQLHIPPNQFFPAIFPVVATTTSPSMPENFCNTEVDHDNLNSQPPFRHPFSGTVFDIARFPVTTMPTVSLSL